MTGQATMTVIHDNKLQIDSTMIMIMMMMMMRKECHSLN